MKISNQIKLFFLLFFKIFKNRPEFQRKFLNISNQIKRFSFCSFSTFSKIDLNFKENVQSKLLRIFNLHFFFFSKFSKIALNFKENFPSSAGLTQLIFFKKGTFRVLWHQISFLRNGTLGAYGAKNFLETGRSAP